jgi:CheY-like chemotaxis protein
MRRLGPPSALRPRRTFGPYLEPLEPRCLLSGLPAQPLTGAQRFVTQVYADLLLLDLYLPKRDGNEVLTHLRASQRCGQIPVVVLTSSDATWDRENAAKNYATHYFQKPSSLDKFMLLGRVVKEVMDRRQSC